MTPEDVAAGIDAEGFHTHNPYEAAEAGCEECGAWVKRRADDPEVCGSPDCPYCPGNGGRL